MNIFYIFSGEEADLPYFRFLIKDALEDITTVKNKDMMKKISTTVSL